MNRLARYQPPPIPPGVLTGLVVVFALFSFSRGLDYIIGHGSDAEALVVLQALGSGNIDAWAYLIMGAALNVLVAYALQRHFLIWLSHVLMAALYLCIVVAIAQALLELHVNGWVALIAPGTTLVWHLVLLTLTRPFPRTGASHGA